MKCPICNKGNLNEKEVKFERHGLFVGMFKAEVCDNCGEEIYSEAEAIRSEKKLKELGLFGPQKSKLYKLGSNLALGIKKSLAESMGLTKDSQVIIIPQPKHKRFIVETM